MESFGPKFKFKLRFFCFSGDNFGTILLRRSRVNREHQGLPPDFFELAQSLAIVDPNRR